MPDAPGWVDAICEIALTWKAREMSIRDLFDQAAPDLADPDAVGRIERHLVDNPEFVEAWQTYSYDKRGSPSPYLDGCQVGFYDAGDRDVTQHANVTSACADFIWREVRWVLTREQ